MQKETTGMLRASSTNGKQVFRQGMLFFFISLARAITLNGSHKLILYLNGGVSE